MPIQIPWSDRLAFVGRTGSGKTFLARHLLAPIPRLVVIDPKSTNNTPDWKLEPWTHKSEQRLLRGERARLHVPYPPDGDWSPYLEAAWQAGNCTVYIDEVYGVTDPGAKPLPALTALYTRGRERKIGTWASTQRPKWIPLFTLSEAEMLFQFRLTLPDDQKFMAGFMGSEVPLPIPPADPFGFWMYSISWQQPEYVRQLTTPKGK